MGAPAGCPNQFGYATNYHQTAERRWKYHGKAGYNEIGNMRKNSALLERA